MKRRIIRRELLYNPRALGERSVDLFPTTRRGVSSLKPKRLLPFLNVLKDFKEIEYRRHLRALPQKASRRIAAFSVHDKTSMEITRFAEILESPPP
jgi:hypothetical protein